MSESSPTAPDGDGSAETSEQVDTIVASLRAEVGALREQVATLRDELVGGLTASSIAVAAVAVELAETGLADPLEVAALAERLAQGANYRPEGREKIDSVLSEFTRILRGTAAMDEGARRPPQDAPKTPRLHIVKLPDDVLETKRPSVATKPAGSGQTRQ